MIKKFLYKMFNDPTEMVSYWKTKEAVKAKVTKAPDGSQIMWMEGEKYPFPGFPRGSLLYGKLSPLKHWIKNLIFNDSWKLLEEGKGSEEVTDSVIASLKGKLKELSDDCKFEYVPYEQLTPPVKELWRAFEATEKKHPSQLITQIKEMMCFIMQEDDGYRFRLQFMAQFYNPKGWFKRDIVTDFYKALELLEHAEIVSDMKERIHLLRRVLLALLGDQRVMKIFSTFTQEIDWKKLRLTKADKYFLRAKYFKADYPYIEY